MSGRRVVNSILFYVVIIAVCAILFFPLYWMFVCSTKSSSELFSPNPSFLPSLSGMGNYLKIFTIKPMARWLLNTVLVSSFSTIVCIIVAVFGAYSLSRFRYRGKNTLQYVMLSTQMIPAVMIIVPLYLVFDSLGLIDNLFGVAIAFITFSLPLCVFLLRGFFDSIPVELEEAAMVDGCTRIGSFIRVTLPLAAPGIGTTAIFAFLLGWGEYLFARTLVMSESNWLISIGISNFIEQHQTLWEQMMTAGIIASIPPVVAFICLQRYVIQGLTAGAIKG